MVHSFIAYIDESGCDGFKFRAPPEMGSSEWFILSAVITVASDDLSITRYINEMIKPIEKRRNSPIKHFSKVNHEQRIPILYRVANSAVKLISVCIYKPELDQNIFKKGWNLYFYGVRLLLERISWYARDNGFPVEGNGQTKLMFAHCKGLSYERLESYFAILRNQQTNIHWNSVDAENLEVRQVHERVGLKIADLAANSTSKALNLTEYGYYEDRYIKILKSNFYTRNNIYRGYGIKLFPIIPEIIEHQDSRYSWLEDFGII